MTIGKNSVVEIPKVGKLFTQGSMEDEIYQIFKAVIEGNFTEEIFVKNDRILKSNGFLYIDDDLKTIKNSSFLAALFRYERKLIEYKPYKKSMED